MWSPIPAALIRPRKRPCNVFRLAAAGDQLGAYVCRAWIGTDVNRRRGLERVGGPTAHYGGIVFLGDCGADHDMAGPSSRSVATVALPYVAWLCTTAAQAEQTAAQARACGDGLRDCVCDIHRNGDSGSPRVMGSTRCSDAAITPGSRSFTGGDPLPLYAPTLPSNPRPRQPVLRPRRSPVCATPQSHELPPTLRHGPMPALRSRASDAAAAHRATERSTRTSRPCRSTAADTRAA